MPRLARLALFAVLSSAALVSAAPRAQAPADSTVSPVRGPRGLAVRISGGATQFALGEMADFHAAVVGQYTAAGVAVPTQRSFGPAPALGVDVLWADGSGRLFGGGLRTASSSAYSLYGDYAGTLDLVSRVSAVFVETVSVVELGPQRAVRPFVGSRGGTVFARAETREALDLGTFGASETTVRGRGIGYSVEGFGGIAASAGPVQAFVQAGYRYARVSRLDGESARDGETVESGQLPYRLALSGWTGTVGIALGRR